MANPAEVLRGADVSHHQEALDVGILARNGFRYVVARTAQAPGGKYGTTKDRAYAKHKANAARAGLLFSSYFYLGDKMSAEGNVSLHASVEPDRNIPVMLDWENGSGNAAFLHACHGAFRNAGYHVWSVYAPRWYWQAQGSQSLAGLPPLVSSRYPDNAPGDYDAEYRAVPESYWTGYGGLGVGMLQFTSSGRVPGYGGNLDLLAYKGSVAQLEDWWNPGTPNPTPKPEGEGEVALLERINVKASMDSTGFLIRSLNGSPQARLIVRPPDVDWSKRTTETPVWQGHVYAYGDGGAGIGHDPMFTKSFDKKVIADAVIPLPGALHARYEYSCAKDFILEVHG
jgi:hypothetical protein